MVGSKKQSFIYVRECMIVHRVCYLLLMPTSENKERKLKDTEGTKQGPALALIATPLIIRVLISLKPSRILQMLISQSTKK